MKWSLLIVLGLAWTIHAQRDERTRRPDDRNDPYYRNYNPYDRPYSSPDRNHNPPDGRQNPQDQNYNAQDRNYRPEDRNFPSYGDGSRQYAPGRWSNSPELGDTRCPNAFNPNTDMTVTVNLDGSRVVQGKYVYLCDGPGRPEHVRPKRGRVLTEFYKNISVFLGIPYAQPPTREKNLRFKPPQPPDAWNVIRADRYMPACPQSTRYYGEHMGAHTIEEDCLYLNIFTPSAKRDQLQKYPTMVYIHGGEWDHGHANSFPPHMLVASQEVVVVTFNYRLGALGFLATADSASPGNYGILDQAMAIEWVYDNIHYFNGDPNKLVLFGPGAGGASAGLHALSPMSRDVVTRVIAQSGSALSDWAAILDPSFMYNSSRLYGEALGCTQQSSYHLVECLRQRSIYDIVNVEKKPEVGWLLWGPVLDNVTAEKHTKFLPLSPEELIESLTNIPQGFAYMAGVTRDEGAAMMMEDDEIKKNRYRVTKHVFQKKIRQYMKMYNYTLNEDAIYQAISFMYTEWSGPDNETLLRQGYIDMLSDSYYVAPNDKIIKKFLEKKIPTYMYMLNYSIQGKPRIPYTDNWVPHNTEYYLVTGAPFMDSAFYPSALRTNQFSWTESDRNISELMMRTWANFADAGDPTPEALFTTITWKPMNFNTLQYLSINTTNLTSVMLRDYRQKQCQFWNHYLPSLIGKEPVTWPPDYEPWEVRDKRVYSAALWSMVGAAALFLILTFTFCCLYCNAKSTHLVEDEEIPESSANHEFLLQGSRDFGRKHEPEMIIMNAGAEKNTRV